MRILFCSILALFLFHQAMAQDYQVSMRSTEKTGYKYEDYPFPAEIMVYTLDKQRVELKTEGLTLIQIWSFDAGSEPEHWARARAMESTYKDKGLTTVSINFENGAGFKGQHQMLTSYFKETPIPEHFYFDGLGYTVDLLHVPGFPAYYLVDDGRVVFRTNGKDEEGLAVLESEIKTRL